MDSTTVIGILIGAVVFAFIPALNLYRRWRSLRSDARSSACLACGSHRVEFNANHARCRDCGFIGAADQGGALTNDEIFATGMDDPGERRRLRIEI